MKIRKGPDGDILGSHLASVVKTSSFVVNGYALLNDGNTSRSSIPTSQSEDHRGHDDCSAHSICAPQGRPAVMSTVQGGVPLSRKDLQGFGGGSFANHSFEPNARFQQNGNPSVASPFFIVLVALKPILVGEFIHVDYGNKFIESSISNMVHYKPS